MERLKALEREILVIDSKITDAQNTGQAAILAGLQKDRNPKAVLKEQIKSVLRQHYQKVVAKEAPNAQTGTAGSAPPDGSAEGDPSSQLHPPNPAGASRERSVGSTVEEHKPVISDSQILAEFWQSRGGTISAPNSGNPPAGPSQIQSHSAMTPEVATQMQKLIDKKGIRPQNFGSTPSSGTTSPETGVHPNVTNNQSIRAPNASTWQGTLSWTFPKLSGQAAVELQLHVVGIMASAGDV